VQEEIKACLGELEAERRENDEVFQTKEVVCATLVGRSIHATVTSPNEVITSFVR
jgi:hypothetical protein